MPRTTIADLETRTDNQRRELDTVRDTVDDMSHDIYGILQHLTRDIDDMVLRDEFVELAARVDDIDRDIETFLNEVRLEGIISRMVDARISLLAQGISTGYNQEDAPPERVIEGQGLTMTITDEAAEALTTQQSIGFSVVTVNDPLNEECESCERKFPVQDVYFNEYTQEMLCFSCNEGVNVAREEDEEVATV